jgi:hypothetical protein
MKATVFSLAFMALATIEVAASQHFAAEQAKKLTESQLGKRSTLHAGT